MIQGGCREVGPLDRFGSEPSDAEIAAAASPLTLRTNQAAHDREVQLRMSGGSAQFA